MSYVRDPTEIECACGLEELRSLLWFGQNTAFVDALLFTRRLRNSKKCVLA